MRSIEAFLQRLIDYAGLFPPASLDMTAAAENYRRNLAQRHSWMLGRFVVPFAASRDDIADKNLSILATPEELIQPKSPPPAESVFEVKVRDASQIADVRKALPIQTIYIEAVGGKWSPGFFDAIAEAKARAKIRTGGITAADFPSAHDIATFAANCKRVSVPWKATAGLHHPFRGVHRLTYEPDSASAPMHGFVNVFLAAALIHSGGDGSAAIDLLNEEDPAAFAFDDGGVTWREFRLSTDQIKAARERFAISFGSCSFAEPVSDLQKFGLL